MHRLIHLRKVYSYLFKLIYDSSYLIIKIVVIVYVYMCVGERIYIWSSVRIHTWIHTCIYIYVCMQV